MQMRHFLHPCLASIGNQSIPTTTDTRRKLLHSGDFGYRPVEIGDFSVRSFFSKMIESHIRPFGDNKYMLWGLRCNISKGQGILSFKYSIIGYFAPQNFGKNILVVITI